MQTNAKCSNKKNAINYLQKHGKPMIKKTGRKVKISLEQLSTVTSMEFKSRLI